MATIYRFVVENKTKGGTSSARKSTTQKATKGASKKGRWVSIFGGEKGGVEHNRKMRAVNPLINKATSGYWEKGNRLGRAGAGLITTNTETGALGISGVAVAIIVSMAIQTLLKIWKKEREIADQANKQNFKMLENGFGSINAAYEIETNVITGRLTYNQNK